MSSPILRFVRITGLSAVAAFVYGLIRSTQPKPTPPASGSASWEPLNGEADAPARSGPVEFVGGAPERPDVSAAEADTDAPAAPQSFAATTSDDEAPAENASTGWVEPDADGGCPDSHPVKGNDQSKIFHVPGGMSYNRTKAERCYCDEATAEADGYRKAKR